jgi:hypothetical protein
MNCAVCGDEIPDDPIADALAKQECFDLFGVFPGEPGAPSVDVVCDLCFPSFARWMSTEAKES